MRVDEFRDDIIRPALKVVGLWSQAAETLLVGTILVESGGVFFKQVSGPALSPFMIEPGTHLFIKEYLNRRRNSILKDKILSACFMPLLPPDDCLIWNLRYATLIARLVYWVRPEKLPDENDITGLTKYYLQYYNTAMGKSTFDKSFKHFEMAHKELANG
jgi:hypothetical protein